MTDTGPEPGTIRLHLHCTLGKLSLKDSNTFNNFRPPKKHFAFSKEDVKILISFPSFISSGIITMHNQSYDSSPSLWAAHAGIPSLTQAQDSCLTTESNTTAEFRASGQESCTLVKPLWHLDQQNTIAQTAAWPASMETTWITIF